VKIRFSKDITWKVAVLLAMSCFMGSVCDTCLGQQAATVRGYVLSADGRPVANANVKVLPLEVGFSGRLPSAITDGSGLYTLVSEPFGRTRIVATKEDAGYPDTRYAIFAPERENMPEVMLTSGAHLDDINIRLPVPDGSIEGRVVSQGTGKVILNARVLLERVDNTQVSESTDVRNGTFLFHLPKRKIEITITAPGFLPLKVIDPDTGRPYLELESYDHKQITAEMKPAS
jgi:hypothetical protein